MTTNHHRSTWVAHPRSHGIDEVDGPPITHTPPKLSNDRMSSTDPPDSGPLPFAAKPTPTATAAVSTMCICVLTVTVIALQVVGLNTTSTVLALIGLAGWAGIVATPAVIRWRQQRPDETGSLLVSRRPPTGGTQTRLTGLVDGNDQGHGEAGWTVGYWTDDTRTEEALHRVRWGDLIRQGQPTSTPQVGGIVFLVWGEAETRLRAKAVGGSEAASRKAVGAGVAGVEDCPLGKGETSSPPFGLEVDGWQ